MAPGCGRSLLADRHRDRQHAATLTRRRAWKGHDPCYSLMQKGEATSRQDATGRTALRIAVEQDAMRRAVTTREVPVLFLNRDPIDDRPAAPIVGRGDRVAGLGTGLELASAGPGAGAIGGWIRWGARTDG